MKFKFINKGVKLSSNRNQVRKKERTWIHLTIKLYLSHSSRLDRPNVLLFFFSFAALKWFQKSFYYYHCSISCVSALELPARSRRRTARNAVKKLLFVAFPANIFKPRRFEDTSELLSANMIWTSESSEIFLSQSEPNYQLRKLKNEIEFLKLFSVWDSICAGLQIYAIFLPYTAH